MSKTKTVTITSKDINASKKIIVSPVLGYKTLTITTTADVKEENLTKEGFMDFLKKIARPLTQAAPKKK